MTRVSLLVGGRSTEHDASLHSYMSVLEDYLLQRPAHITISFVFYIGLQGGVYKHRIDGGADFPRSEQALTLGQICPPGNFIKELVDTQTFLFSLLHGNEGEDGAFQGIAEVFDLPGNFGSVYAACVSMHKWTQALIAHALFPQDLRRIDTLLVAADADSSLLEEVIHHFRGRSCVIKPNSMGASLLTWTVAQLSVSKLQQYQRDIAPYDRHLLVQERIYGTEYTCGCLRTPEGCISLPVIEAVTKEGFLGHYEKHANAGVLPVLHRDLTDTTQKIQLISTELFEWMEYPDMCRFDYIVDEDESIHFLEANTLPGLMRGSAYPKMLQAMNYTLMDVLTASIHNFYGRKRRKKMLRYCIES